MKSLKLNPIPVQPPSALASPSNEEIRAPDIKQARTTRFSEMNNLTVTV